MTKIVGPILSAVTSFLLLTAHGHAITSGEPILESEKGKYASIVQLHIFADGGNQFFGTGFHIGNGKIVTAYHNLKMFKNVSAMTVRSLFNEHIANIELSTSKVSFPAGKEVLDANGTPYMQPDIALIEPTIKTASDIAKLPALEISTNPMPRDVWLYVAARVPYTQAPQRGRFIDSQLEDSHYKNYALDSNLELLVPFEFGRSEKLGLSSLVQSNSGAPLLYEDANGKLKAVGVVSRGYIVRANPKDPKSSIYGQWNVFARFSSDIAKAFVSKGGMVVANNLTQPTRASVATEPTSIPKTHREFRRQDFLRLYPQATPAVVELIEEILASPNYTSDERVRLIKDLVGDKLKLPATERDEFVEQVFSLQ